MMSEGLHDPEAGGGAADGAYVGEGSVLDQEETPASSMGGDHGPPVVLGDMSHTRWVSAGEMS